MISKDAHDLGLHDGSEGGADRVQVAANDLPRQVGLPSEELARKIGGVPMSPGAGAPIGGTESGSFFQRILNSGGGAAIPLKK